MPDPHAGTFEAAINESPDAGFIENEVALIVAEKGRQLNLIADEMFAPIVLVVIVTTLLTPILLNIAFTKELRLLRKMRRDIKAPKSVFERQESAVEK